jgi:hypothetical protein
MSLAGRLISLPQEPPQQQYAQPDGEPLPVDEPVTRSSIGTKVMQQVVLGPVSYQDDITGEQVDVREIELNEPLLSPQQSPRIVKTPVLRLPEPVRQYINQGSFQFNLRFFLQNPPPDQLRYPKQLYQEVLKLLHANVPVPIAGRFAEVHGLKEVVLMNWREVQNGFYEIVEIEVKCERHIPLEDNPAQDLRENSNFENPLY